MPLYLSDKMLSQISLQKFHNFICQFRYQNLPPLPLEIWVQIMLCCADFSDKLALIKAYSQLQLLMDTSTALRKEIFLHHLVCCDSRWYNYAWRLDGEDGIQLLWLMIEWTCDKYYVIQMIVDDRSEWKTREWRISIEYNRLWEETKTTISKSNLNQPIILEDKPEDQILEAPLCYLADFLRKFIPWFQDNRKECKKRRSLELIDFIMSHFPFHHFY